MPTSPMTQSICTMVILRSKRPTIQHSSLPALCCPAQAYASLTAALGCTECIGPLTSRRRFTSLLLTRLRPSPRATLQLGRMQSSTGAPTPRRCCVPMAAALCTSTHLGTPSLSSSICTRRVSIFRKPAQARTSPHKPARARTSPHKPAQARKPTRLAAVEWRSARRLNSAKRVTAEKRARVAAPIQPQTRSSTLAT